MKRILIACVILCLSAIAAADRRSHEARHFLHRYQKKLLRYQRSHAAPAKYWDARSVHDFSAELEIDFYVLGREIRKYEAGLGSAEELRQKENQVSRDFEVQPPLLAESSAR